MNGVRRDPQEPRASRSSLRVAVVTETYPPEVNGVAMTMARMVDGLRERQHRVQLIRPRQHRAERPGGRPELEEVLVRDFERALLDVAGFGGLLESAPRLSA